MLRELTALALVAGVGFAAHADFIGPNLPGNTQFDGWENLTRTNPQVAAASFPDFPGATPWPEPIDSDATGSGDAEFDKTSGFGYPAGVSIYASPFGNGTFSVSDSTPVADIETVVFQIEIGSGSAGWLSADPELVINGSTVVPLFRSGVLDSVFDPAGPFGPLTINTFGYQWDLTGLGPVTSIDVQFAPDGTSTTIWALQLDQGSQFVPVGVPEPASLALLAVGGATMLWRRRQA